MKGNRFAESVAFVGDSLGFVGQSPKVRRVGVNRRFVLPSAAYGYKPYTVTLSICLQQIGWLQIEFVAVADTALD